MSFSFDDAREVDQLAYAMRLADWPRGLNRARIDELFNGFPPFTDEEAEENQSVVNVNFLESTRIGHDARSQYYNAFLKSGNFFTMRTDGGPKHKRHKYGVTVTRNLNRYLKRSQDYYECFRSKLALLVMHGIGPAAWPDEDSWCPTPLGISDIGIPARTYLTMRNLPFFYIYRTYSAPELMKLVRGPKVDPGWNMPMVNEALEWIDKQSVSLMGNNWPEMWAPERSAERIKGDGGFFVGDQIPTLNAFDFYFFSKDDKTAGWRRRIVLDAWSTPQRSGEGWTSTRRSGNLFGSKQDGFLYTSGKRKYADKREQIIGFQFADLSAVAPFQYHSVRSLGFLLYAVCHLQNRLRCAFSEAVFENLLQMFRIKSMEDVQRALKLKVHNFSFIDDNLTPVPASERFQPNVALVELGLQHNQQSIQENSASYTQNQNFSRDRVEKTKFQVMAEVNAMTSLVSAGLNQAYQYQTFEFYEIVRRFMKRKSEDPEVSEFRASCLRDGLPDKMLCAEYWDVEPERVMGAGNKTLEMTIAQQLMEWRPLYSPDAQTEILRDATLAITDDPARADRLVPERPTISDSAHDAELAFGTLMQGVPVTPKPGLNSAEVAGTMIRLMGQKVQAIVQTGSNGTPQDISGLMLAGKYAGIFLQALAGDDQSKPLARKLAKILGQIMSDIGKLAQAQQQAAQQAAMGQNGQAGLDPKDAAKIEATRLAGQQKVQQMRESHAAKTAQRKIQFAQELELDRMRNEAELEREAQSHQMEIAAEDMKAAAEIRRERVKSENTPEAGSEE